MIPEKGCACDIRVVGVADRSEELRDSNEPALAQFTELKAENARLRAELASATAARPSGATGATEQQLRLIVESATDYAILTTVLERRVTSWSAGAE